jgi:hypothetical protein
VVRSGCGDVGIDDSLEQRGGFINGESFRLKDKRKAGVLGSPARIARR